MKKVMTAANCTEAMDATSYTDKGLTCSSWNTVGRFATSKLKHDFRVCYSQTGRVSGTAGARPLVMAVTICTRARSL